MADARAQCRFTDRLGSLFLEHGRLERENGGVVFFNHDAALSIPFRRLTMLQLGPGTVVTHAAMRLLADSGCMVAWTDASGCRVYAHGSAGCTADRLLRQAWLYAHRRERLRVARKLLEKRTGLSISPHTTMQGLMGMEGAWMRDLFQRHARESGVAWHGRQQGDWESADPVNRALSVANSCLYGICHAAIVAMGCSPAIGFLHTGDMRSFVFDVADLYKPRTTIPLAFQSAAAGGEGIERRVRETCSTIFREQRLGCRIIPDILEVLNDPDDPEERS